MKSNWWLPVEIAIGLEPTLSSEFRVHWMDFQGVTLSHPFFLQTVSAVRDRGGPTREIETYSGVLSRVARDFRSCAPVGVICHISRCGSTVVANCLRHGQDVVVASEARPICHLAMPSVCRSLVTEQHWDAIRTSLFRSVSTIFSNFGGVDKQLIIKFMSMNTLCIDFIRSVWPEVPIVVLIRDPREVLAANIHDSQGMLYYKDDPYMGPILSGCKGGMEGPVSRSEFCSQVVENFLLNIHRRRREAGLTIIDHSEITVDKVLEIADAFQLNGRIAAALIVRELSLYSKDYTRTRVFREDSLRKQATFAAEVECGLSDRVLEIYSALRVES